MVAEPVHATLDALSYAYNQTTSFVSQQQQRLTDELERLSLSEPPKNASFGYSPKGPAFPHYKVSLTLLTVGLGAGAVWVWRRQRAASAREKPKRRVPKLANGARQDVVLVVGSPTEPFTRLIALDFERRGFIVYLTILDQKDFKYIESNPITDDMNYLNLTDTITFENQLSKFHGLLRVPVTPFPGAEPHNLRLAGVVFAPRFHFPVGPVENVSAASWVVNNDKLLTYIKLFASGLTSLVRSQDAKIIAIIPSITADLTLPYRAAECVFQSSLASFFTSLSQEVRQHGVYVTQVKLGNIYVSPNSNPRTSNQVDSEIRSWNSDMKELYSASFAKSQHRSNPIRSGRAHLRDLYHVVFDLVYSKKPNPPVVYCGTGARGYDWLASLLPRAFIQWVLA